MKGEYCITPRINYQLDNIIINIDINIDIEGLFMR